MAQRNEDQEGQDQDEPVRQEIDLVAYMQMVLGGLIHPEISHEVREMNYLYLSRYAVDFPGLEELFEEVEESYNSNDKQLPSLAYMRTKHIKFDEFMLTAIERLGSAGSLPSHQDYRKAVDEYVDEWERRDLRNILATAADLANKSPADALKYIDDHVKDVSASHKPISEMSFREVYETDLNRGRIFPSHLKPLDEKIGNFRLGTTCILAGFRSHFKTTVGMNILYNGVVRNGFHCCALSMEMSKVELMQRLMVRHAQHFKFGDRHREITLRRVQLGLLTDEEKSFLFDEVEPDWKAAITGKLEILDSSDFVRLTMSEVHRKLQQVERQLGGCLHALFVDYIQLFAKVGMENTKFARGVFEAVGLWARWFQQLGKKFGNGGIFICLLAQTSGDAYKEAEKNEGRYESSRVVGESKEIEDAADYIISLYCSEDMKFQKMMKVQLLKNRHGESFIMVPEQISIDPERFVVHDWSRSEELDAFTIDVM